MKSVIIYPFFIRLMSILAFPLVLLFLVSACVTQEQHGTGNSAQESLQPWSVILSVSGGIAGMVRNISIDSDGLVIINDLKTNKSSRSKINSKELALLSNLINQQIRSLKPPSTLFSANKCADCFQYKLSIRWQNGQKLAVLNDINLGKSPYQDIVRFLRKTMLKY